LHHAAKGGNVTRSIADIEAQRARADLIAGHEVVAAAVDGMAAEIRAAVGGLDPVVMVVMTGGLMPAAWLMSRMDFPYAVDYLHPTRYRGRTTGGEVHWLVRPRLDLAGRHVLVVDDILDEGVTQNAIVDLCMGLDAASVRTAVLVRKRHDRRPADVRADFVGLDVEDRYVFGCGMDYREYYRGLPAIYALADE
jgi:hypoxanthine phosphoribosyltransferase